VGGGEDAVRSSLQLPRAPMRLEIQTEMETPVIQIEIEIEICVRCPSWASWALVC
jgi:hypothetical protein